MQDAVLRVLNCVCVLPRRHSARFRYVQGYKARAFRGEHGLSFSTKKVGVYPDSPKEGERPDRVLDEKDLKGAPMLEAI